MHTAAAAGSGCSWAAPRSRGAPAAQPHRIRAGPAWWAPQEAAPTPERLRLLRAAATHAGTVQAVPQAPAAVEPAAAAAGPYQVDGTQQDSSAAGLAALPAAAGAPQLPRLVSCTLGQLLDEVAAVDRHVQHSRQAAPAPAADGWEPYLQQLVAALSWRVSSSVAAGAGGQQPHPTTTCITSSSALSSSTNSRSLEAGGLSPGALVQLCAHLASLGFRPASPHLTALLAATQPHLASSSLQDLTALLQAAADLRFCPPHPWLLAWQAASAPLLAAGSLQQLLALARAVVSLRVTPAAAWSASWAAALEQQLQGSSPARLMAVLQLLAEQQLLGWLPPSRAQQVVDAGVAAAQLDLPHLLLQQPWQATAHSTLNSSGSGGVVQCLLALQAGGVPLSPAGATQLGAALAAAAPQLPGSALVSALGLLVAAGAVLPPPCVAQLAVALAENAQQQQQQQEVEAAGLVADSACVNAREVVQSFAACCRLLGGSCGVRPLVSSSTSDALSCLLGVAVQQVVAQGAPWLPGEASCHPHGCSRALDASDSNGTSMPQAATHPAAAAAGPHPDITLLIRCVEAAAAAPWAALQPHLDALYSATRHLGRGAALGPAVELLAAWGQLGLRQQPRGGVGKLVGRLRREPLGGLTGRQLVAAVGVVAGVGRHQEAAAAVAGEVVARLPGRNGTWSSSSISSSQCTEEEPAWSACNIVMYHQSQQQQGAVAASVLSPSEVLGVAAYLPRLHAKWPPAVVLAVLAAAGQQVVEGAGVSAAGAASLGGVLQEVSEVWGMLVAAAISQGQSTWQPAASRQPALQQQQQQQQQAQEEDEEKAVGDWTGHKAPMSVPPTTVAGAAAAGAAGDGTQPLLLPRPPRPSLATAPPSASEAASINGRNAAAVAVQAAAKVLATLGSSSSSSSPAGRLHVSAATGTLLQLLPALQQVVAVATTPAGHTSDTNSSSSFNHSSSSSSSSRAGPGLMQRAAAAEAAEQQLAAPQQEVAAALRAFMAALTGDTAGPAGPTQVVRLVAACAQLLAACERPTRRRALQQHLRSGLVGGALVALEAAAWEVVMPSQLAAHPDMILSSSSSSNSSSVGGVGSSRSTATPSSRCGGTRPDHPHHQHHAAHDCIPPAAPTMDAALGLLLAGRAHSLLGGRGASPGYHEQLEGTTARCLHDMPPRQLAALWRRAAALQLPAGFRPWQQLGVKLVLLRVRHLEAGDMVACVAALVEAGMRPTPAALTLCLRPVFTVPAAHAPDHASHHLQHQHMEGEEQQQVQQQQQQQQQHACNSWQHAAAMGGEAPAQHVAPHLPPALAGLTLHHHLLLLEALAHCRARLPAPWWRTLMVAQAALLPSAAPDQLLLLGWAVVGVRAAPVTRGAAWLRLWCGCLAAAAGAGALSGRQVLQAALLCGHLDLLPARTTLHCGARGQLLAALEAAAGPGWHAGLRAALSARLATNATQLQAAWQQRPAAAAAARNAAAQQVQQRRGGRLRGHGDALPGVVVVGEGWAHTVRGLQLERRALLWTAASLCSEGGRRSGLVRRAAAWLLPHAPMLNPHVAARLMALLVTAATHTVPPQHDTCQQVPGQGAWTAAAAAADGQGRQADARATSSGHLVWPGPSRDQLLLLAGRLVACLGWAHSGGTLDLLATLRRLQAALGAQQERCGPPLPLQQQQLEVTGSSSNGVSISMPVQQQGPSGPWLLGAVEVGGQARGRQLVGGALLRSLPWLAPARLSELLPAVVALAGRPPPGLLLEAAQQVVGRGLTPNGSSSSRELLAGSWFVVNACALATSQVQAGPARPSKGKGLVVASRQLVRLLWEQLAGRWQQQQQRRSGTAGRVSSGWLLQLPLLLGVAGESAPVKEGAGSSRQLAVVAQRHLQLSAALGLLPAAVLVPVMGRCAALQLRAVLRSALAVDWVGAGVPTQEAAAAAVAWTAHTTPGQQQQQVVPPAVPARHGAHPLAVASLQLRLTGLLRWAFMQATAAAPNQQAAGSSSNSVRPGLPDSGQRLLLPPPGWAQSLQDMHMAATTVGTLDFQCVPQQLPCMPADEEDPALEPAADVALVVPLLSAALELKFARVVREVVAVPAAEAGSTW